MENSSVYAGVTFSDITYGAIVERGGRISSPSATYLMINQLIIITGLIRPLIDHIENWFPQREEHRQYEGYTAVSLLVALIATIGWMR